jgi:pimeloyl-ACP methyl ester carboxylesterase
MNSPFSARRCAALFFAFTALFALSCGAAPSRAEVFAKADRLIADPAFADYRGWLKYLKFRTDADAQRLGYDSPAAAQALERLADWTGRIEADPQILGKLRGAQEWAYESRADGSGQPFRLNIPTDYDGSRATPLSLYAHGYSGNHVEFTTGWKDKTGAFEMSILGRSRGGFFHGLSEADVMDALAYVRAHWNIDSSRIFLNGGSMGGLASYWLGARHPEIWASIRPDCGIALEAPLGNLRHTPAYAIHSRDDNVVPILQDKASVRRLRELGGMAVYEQIDGFKHAAWDYVPGNTRAAAWELEQVRPDPKTVRDIDFTALDAASARGWWARVAFWGDEPRPARMILSFREGNFLYVTLDNIAVLAIDTKDSPLDCAKPLRLSADGAVFLTVPAPLPETILLARKNGEWTVIPTLPECPARPHTPGGSDNVYDGSPILIVYGTTGTAQENAAMKDAARHAARSPNASWPDDNIDRSPADGVSHYQLLYGELPVKADSEVTDADIAEKNLVLIGTAAQNSLVAKMAEKLPVGFRDGRIVFSDGADCPSQENALGLTYFNPLAPKNLILWLASEDAGFYRAGAPLPQILSVSPGVDAAVMDSQRPTLLIARAFNTGWNWCAGRYDSPLLPENCLGEEDAARWMAGVLAKATNSEFGARSRTFRMLYRLVPSLSFTPHITRQMDVSLFYYNRPILTAPLSGKALTQLNRQIKSSPIQAIQIFPDPDALEIDSQRNYNVAFTAGDLWALTVTGAIVDEGSLSSVDTEAAILNYRGE